MRILFFALVTLLSTTTLMAQNYDAAWQEINSLNEEGKYRSALEKTEALYRTAAADGSVDEQLKALFHRTAFVVELEEDGPEAAIELLQRTIDDSSDPAFRAVNHYALGRLTLGGLNYQNEAPTATAEDEDDQLPITEWSNERLVKTGTQHLLTALELAADARITLNKIDAIVEYDEALAYLKPTLYDLLVYEVLEALNGGYAYLAEPVYAFRPDADLLFLPAREFAEATVSTRDTNGLNYRSFRIYQRLISDHLRDEDPSTLHFANLNRLEWANQLTGDNEAFYAALVRREESSSLYPFRLARLIFNDQSVGASEGDENLNYVRARKIAQSILDKYPGTPSAYGAQQLIDQIERFSLSLVAEETIVPESAVLINVEYRNLERLHYRLIAETFDPLLDQRGTEVDIAALRRRPAIQSGSMDLAPNDDFKGHRTEMALTDLAPGYYRLLVGASAAFDSGKESVTQTLLKVSSLALLQYTDDNRQEGIVVDRTTGAPVAGVTAIFYRREGRYDNPTLRETGRTTTQADGRIVLRTEARGNNIVVLQKDKDRHVVAYNSFRNRTNDRPSFRTHLFLDRSIYRPGQTLYFKGIATEIDPRGIPEIQLNQKQEVLLVDANGQEVGRKVFTTDEYGAFAGQFQLPSSGLNGQYRINVAGRGGRGFRVEAYKRPRFEVLFDPREEAVTPGDSVSVTGTALGFAGPAVAGATVTYRVERQQANYWWGSRWGGNQETEAILATGTTTTDADGKFSINFRAIVPEGQAGGLYRPAFLFKVYADVSDVTGETHAAETDISTQARGNRVGLSAPMQLDRAKDASLSVNVQLSGEGLEATLAIVPVTHPEPAPLERLWGIPDRPAIEEDRFRELFPLLAYRETPAVEEWDSRGAAVTERSVRISGDTSFQLPVESLLPGHYRIEIRYRSGAESLTESQAIRVLNSGTGELPEGLFTFLETVDAPLLPGQQLELPFLSAEPLPHVFTHWDSRDAEISSTLAIGDREVFAYPITEDDRGGLNFSLRFVRHNRFFNFTRRMAVEWPGKRLEVTLETFRDKLRPGAAEEWRIRVAGADGQAVDAQLLASMYDASLDQFVNNRWDNQLEWFPTNFYIYRTFVAANFGSVYASDYYRPAGRASFNFGREPRLITEPLDFYLLASKNINYLARPQMAMARSQGPPSPPPPPGAELIRDEMEAGDLLSTRSKVANTAPEAPAPVSIRENLSETAFWQPDIRPQDDGSYLLAFTAPEALTRWNLQLVAHTPALARGYERREVLTQKELMILPNAPRFLREGDVIEFTAKVSNLSDGLLNGTATLELFDPQTDELLPMGGEEDFKVAGLGEGSKAGSRAVPFSLGADKSAAVTWKIEVPGGSAGLIGYRVIARAEGFSDGEQNTLPVLTNRVYLTATKPFFLRPKEKETVTLAALANSASASGKLEHKGFTFELTNDPSWLVVKSLPYLMEYPYDCTEQLANRFFANQLSRTIVESNPNFQKVFDAWKADPDALKSPLALNQDLKQLLLEETPWLRDAADESEQRERLSVLFDLNRLASELEAAFAKLEQRQSADGSFSWFPGGPANRYMTQYVAETLTRLSALGATTGSMGPRITSLVSKTYDFLDYRLREDFAELQRIPKKKEMESYCPNSMELHYLYVRSAADLAEKPLDDATRQAFDYYLTRAKQCWTDYGLYEQALLSITLAQLEDNTGNTIIESLRERAIRSEELGMYWKYPRGYAWQQLPIETHCRIMEAFQIWGTPREELYEMQLWLLQNKRTNRWETTKATAAAAYAFLTTDQGVLKIASEQRVKVKFPGLDKSVYTPTIAAAEASAEAATGYYRSQWKGTEVTPDFASVQLKNKDQTVAWGALYWQFTQEIDAVEANAESPLRLKRRLFRRINTPEGERLEAISAGNPMRPGERLVVQLVVSTDRDMEYVHLKDRRAAGLEPTEQLSGYRYGGGLGHYFSPDDLAVNFFFDYLPRGTYTLEYDLFVNHAGDFSNGLSVLQCMYAPEFSAYSDGSRLRVE